MLFSAFMTKHSWGWSLKEPLLSSFQNITIIMILSGGSQAWAVFYEWMNESFIVFSTDTIINDKQLWMITLLQPSRHDGSSVSHLVQNMKVCSSYPGKWRKFLSAFPSYLGKRGLRGFKIDLCIFVIVLRAMVVYKYFDQLLSARSNPELVEIHNKCIIYIS